MNPQWRQWIARFDGLSFRERILILVTVLAAAVLPIFMYVVEPLQEDQLNLTTQVAKLKASNANRQLDIQTLKSAKRKDPNTALNLQIAQQRQRLLALDRSLKARTAQLVSAAQMLQRLETLLAAHKGLKLVEMNKAEPRPLVLSTGAAESAESAESGLYRHDLQLVVEGGYFDLLGYLQALEQLPQGFFWDAIDYQVEDYPGARVSLQLHTLSTEQGWLGV